MIDPIALDGHTWLMPRRPEHTAGIFAAVERSREHLRAWLDWVDTCTSEDDINARQQHAEELHRRGELVEFVIARDGTIVGKVDLHTISPSDGSARIGYWLSAEAEGRGTATEAVKCVNRFGFETIGLNCIEIWTAAGNLREPGSCDPGGLRAKHRNRHKIRHDPRALVGSGTDCGCDVSVDADRRRDARR